MNKRLFTGESLVINETDPFGDGSVKSFYRFDNNMDDSSGNGFNGSKESGITFSSSNQKVGTHMINSMGDASNKQITLPNSFNANETMTFWIKLLNSGDRTFYIFQKKTAAYYFLTLEMGVYSGQDKVFAYIRDSTSKYRYASANIDFTLNDWSFVTYRYNSSAGTHHFSLNGGTEIQLTTNYSASSIPPVPNSTNTIVGERFFNGVTYNFTPFHFDHYRSFNRVLTQSEITQLYNENA